MSMMQRRKGKRIERELAAFLTRLGFPSRRGQQYHGGGDSPDVVCDALDGLHLECKASESMDVGSQLLAGAYRQAVDDAGDKIPVVMWRRNRRPWAMTWRSGGVLVTVCGDADIKRALDTLAGDLRRRDSRTAKASTGAPNATPRAGGEAGEVEKSSATLATGSAVLDPIANVL